MLKQINYFDTEGNLRQIDADDNFGIALLKRFKYVRANDTTLILIRNYRENEIAYFSNELAFINCLAKWNNTNNPLGWYYYPAPDWAFPKE